MTSIHYDSPLADAERRAQLYAAGLFVYGPTASSRRLVELGIAMAVEAFTPLDPQRAQFELPVTRYAQILAALKPAFIHHPECKRLLPGLLAELGCDPQRTYFDVPRMRTVTSGNYLTTGIAYDFHPHRDTWYSAPFCQLNWWLPIYEFVGDSSMAFHPRYFSEPIRNGSSDFNYYEWNAHQRKEAAQHITSDTRRQPKAEEPIELH